jgi:hypothetical protein
MFQVTSGSYRTWLNDRLTHFYAFPPDRPSLLNDYIPVCLNNSFVRDLLTSVWLSTRLAKTFSACADEECSLLFSQNPPSDLTLWDFSIVNFLRLISLRSTSVLSPLFVSYAIQGGSWRQVIRSVLRNFLCELHVNRLCLAILTLLCFSASEM